MPGHFKYIIVGRGMMGAAAARHLASQTDGVALIGPGEPKEAAAWVAYANGAPDDERLPLIGHRFTSSVPPD